jgi:hypothetical protein
MRAIAPVLAVFCTGLTSGCAIQPSGPVTAASYCKKQGSARGVEQCQQYYAKNSATETPQPVVYQSGPAGRCQDYGYEPGTALFLDCINMQQQAVSRFVGQMQQQQRQNYQQQMQLYQPRPAINCSSNLMGNFVSTTCN